MRKIVIIVALWCVGMAWAQEMVQPIRVGLLLPLQAEATQRDRNMNRFADFYTGALIAVYEMQATGQQVEVSTWDVGRSTNRLEQLLATDTLKGMDMIIGPVYPAQVKGMVAWTAAHHVMTLLPFTSEVPGIATNPYLLQFNPSEEKEAEAMVTYLEERKDSVRVILVEAEESTIPTSVRQLVKKVKDSGLMYSYTTVEQILADSLAEVLSDTMENILVMNTERYANVRKVMPNLSRAAQGRQLTLMSRYAWQDDPIILPQLYATVFGSEIAIDSVAYGSWYRQWIPKERVESRPCYDLLGYDMMGYALQTIQALRQVESDDEREQVVGRWYEGIQSNIRFERSEAQGGYQNSHIQIVRLR